MTNDYTRTTSHASSEYIMEWWRSRCRHGRLVWMEGRCNENMDTSAKKKGSVLFLHPSQCEDDAPKILSIQFSRIQYHYSHQWQWHSFVAAKQGCTHFLFCGPFLPFVHSKVNNNGIHSLRHRHLSSCGSLKSK